MAIRLTDESYMDIPLPSSPSSVHINALFEAVGVELGVCAESFYLEINGNLEQYEKNGENSKLLQNTLELTVLMTFASSTRWAWVRAATCR